MSEQVQTIVEAVLRLTAEQRRELMQALAGTEAAEKAAGESRSALVQSVQGKYAWVAASSEAFLKQKQVDLASEAER